MNRMILCLMAIGLALLFAGSALAQAGLVRTVEEGCQKEINNYCKNVTQGENSFLGMGTSFRTVASSRSTTPPFSLNGRSMR